MFDSFRFGVLEERFAFGKAKPPLSTNGKAVAFRNKEERLIAMGFHRISRLRLRE